MNALRTFCSVTLLVLPSACADVGASATLPPSLDIAGSTSDRNATATSNPAAFSGDTQQRASVDACEQGTQHTELWRADIGEGDPILPLSVKTDGSRNAYVTRASGELVKLDASGAKMWTKQFGSLVDIDGAGTIFVAGTFEGSLRVSPSQTLSSAGGRDVFVAKLDQDGDVLAAVALGGAGDESAKSIAATTSGVVVSATALGTVSLDEELETVWTRPLEGAVASDGVGNVVVAGALVGSATFDTTLTSNGGQDVLVVELSPQGDYLWSRSYGDAGSAQLAESVAIDPSGAILVGGSANGSVDFGGGAITVPSGTCPSESPCDTAGFVVKLDASGAFVWSRGVVPAAEISGIVADAAGNVYAAGSYPGDAAPYRTPLLVGFDGEGSKRKLPAYDGTPGAGHALATDACGNVLFAFAAAGTSSSAQGHAYVAKLLVP